MTTRKALKLSTWRLSKLGPGQLSRAAFARALGVDRVQLQRWEKAKLLRPAGYYAAGKASWWPYYSTDQLEEMRALIARRRNPAKKFGTYKQALVGLRAAQRARGEKSPT